MTYLSELKPLCDELSRLRKNDDETHSKLKLMCERLNKLLPIKNHPYRYGNEGCHIGDYFNPEDTFENEEWKIGEDDEHLSVCVYIEESHYQVTDFLEPDAYKAFKEETVEGAYCDTLFGCDVSDAGEDYYLEIVFEQN